MSENAKPNAVIMAATPSEPPAASPGNSSREDYVGCGATDDEFMAARDKAIREAAANAALDTIRQAEQFARYSEPSATNMAERYGTAGHALAAASASDAASQNGLLLS